MSLFSVYVPRDYFNVTHDALRMVCIQVIVQFLFSVVNGQDNPFFSLLFFQTISFVIMGVLFYWLVLSYVIGIKTDTLASETDTARAYSPATHDPANEPWKNETKSKGKIESASHLKDDEMEVEVEVEKRNASTGSSAIDEEGEEDENGGILAAVSDRTPAADRLPVE